MNNNIKQYIKICPSETDIIYLQNTVLMNNFLLHKKTLKPFRNESSKSEIVDVKLNLVTKTSKQHLLANNLLT